MLRVACTSVLLVLATACAGTTTQQVAVDAETTVTSSSTTSTTAAPDCASTLPSSAQASQLLMVMVNDPTHATDALAGGLIGGFGLKGNQRSDVDELISQATADSPLPATVAVDEEGGPVQRLRFSAGRIPSAAELGEGTASDAAQIMGDHAQLMSEIGVTMDFAPVADLRNEQVLAERTYSDDAVTVGRYASAVADSIAAAGVTPVVKHWPGIGGADTDPHDALPVLAGIEELRTDDLRAFEPVLAGGNSAVMVAHAEVPGLTAPGEPASLSREAITGELRGRSGFNGVVITDSLGMGAVVSDMTQADAAVQAVSAGADIALLSGTDVVQQAHNQLTSAIENGEIATEQIEESVRRVLAMKGIEGECLDAISAHGAIGRARAEQREQSEDPVGEPTDGDVADDGSGTGDGGTDGGGTGDGGTDGSGTGDGGPDGGGTGGTVDRGINDTGT